MKIVETNSAIEEMIMGQIKEHFRMVVKQARPDIEKGIRFRVIEEIKKQPEYHSILNGRLLGEFGLTDVTAKVGKILDAWGADIDTTITPLGIRIEMIRSDFSNVLQLEEAKQLTNKGESLEWLDWLLVQGDKTIIKEYEISIDRGNKRSRTGLAVMIKKKRGKWHVPSQYAGTRRNNWVTRAVDRMDDSLIENVIERAITAKW